MTTERVDRAPFPHDDAAAELRRLASQGVLDARATQAVLQSRRSKRSQSAPPLRGPQNPGGLSAREVEVLRLAVRGVTLAQSPRSTSPPPEFIVAVSEHDPPGGLYPRILARLTITVG
jgi:hypothetical protein